MKVSGLFLIFFITYIVSAQSQETPKQSKLLKKPRVYNAIVKSDEELIPSQSYPAVAPVIRPVYTGLYPYAPVIIPQIQPYGLEEYGNLKVSPDYGEERADPSVDYPSKDLTPPSPNQPKPTYRAPSIEVDQVPFDLQDEIPLPRVNGSSLLESTIDYDSNVNKPEGSPQPLNYEGDFSPTGMDDSYFPQDLNSKNQQSNNDFGSFLQPPSSPKQKSGSEQPVDVNPFQSFFNYQPQNSDIPNVPPPPLPVTQNSNNSTKKKMQYPNAPPTLFSL